MKYEVQGRVIGHAIFSPNPKDYPDLELVKIALSITPATTAADKHTKAVLVVEKDAAWSDLVLGRMVSITVRDSQQDALLPAPSDRGETAATVSMKDPATGKTVSAPLDKVSAALAKGGIRGDRGRAH